MSKQLRDFKVASTGLAGGCRLLNLVPEGDEALPEILPGQFAQLLSNAAGVLLRRPISICDVTPEGQVVLMVKPVGAGTQAICELQPGDKLNMVLPLGNGFDVSKGAGKRVILVGGGVGIAPLVYLSRCLLEAGADVNVALGARDAAGLAGVAAMFPEEAKVFVATEDGSLGVHGRVTACPVFEQKYDVIYCCGPTPMMKAVASLARERDCECYVSLENMMGCGIGACLCCVEKTVKGNVCVCTEGPVFNTDQLLWK